MEADASLGAPFPSPSGTSSVEGDELPTLSAPIETPRSPIGVVQIVLGISVLSGCVWVYGSLQSAILEETFPLFLLSFILKVSPLVFVRNPDSASPPIYNALTGAVSTLAEMALLMSNQDIVFGGLSSLGYQGRIHLMNLVSVASCLSSVSYLVGYYGTKGLFTSRFFPAMPGRSWSTMRLGLVTAACLAAFTATYAIFQSRVGTDLSELSLADGKAVLHEDRSVTWIERGVQLGMLPFYLLTARILGQKKKNRYSLAMLGVGALGVAFLSMRLGGRGTGTFFLITLGIIVHFLWKRVPLVALLPAGFAIIIGMNFLGELRKTPEEASNVESTNRFSVSSALGQHAQDRSRLTASAVVIDAFPDRVDYLKGETFLALPFAPIPKWIWPDKSKVVEWQDNGIVYKLTGLPAPSDLTSIFYANFGWIGIVVGMTAWGAFHRGLFVWLAKGDARATVPLYATTLVNFSFTSLGIGAALGGLVPLFIVIRFIEERRRTTSRLDMLK